MPKSASKALRKKLDCLLCTYNEKTDQTEYCLEHNADLIEIDGVLTMPIGASYKCPVTPAATRGKRGKYGSWLSINLQGALRHKQRHRSVAGNMLGLSFRDLEQKYGVPRQTIADKVRPPAPRLTASTY